MERVLGSARLSNASEESVSIESQRSDINLVADYRHAQTVHVAVDDGVSGGLSPFEREGLGPWLTEPSLLAQWDTLAVAKLDRLTRSLLHFAGLIQWAEDNGKNIVSKAESIDLSTPAGRMLAQIIVLFAEFERARMAERSRQSKKYRREHGAITAGSPKFGYATERRGSMLYLVEGKHAETWRKGAEKLSDGSKASIVAQWLESVAGGSWDASRVMRTYRDPVYRGYVTAQRVTGLDASGKRVHARHNPDVIYGDDGRPVTHDAPLIDDHGWHRLQRALDRLTITRATGAEVRELSGIVMCAECGATLVYNAFKSGDHRYRHPKGSKCPGDGAVTFPAKAIEEAFRSDFMAVHGARQTMARVITGEDLTGVIADLERRQAEVEQAVTDGDMPAKAGGKILAAIEEDLESARSAPGQSVDLVPTGTTLADEWESYSPAERNEFLRKRKVAVLVRRGTVGRPWQVTEWGDLPTLEAMYRQAMV